MKPTLLSVAVLAAAVSADTVTTTATTTTTACAAEAILDACLDTTEGYVSLCGGQDYSCLCDKYTAIMTCFANCPNDSRQYALDSERQLYCANASAFSTKTTTTNTATQSSSGDTNAATTTDAASTNKATATTSRGATNTASDDSFTTPSGAAVHGVERGPGLLAAFGLAAAALL
ncbi:hypothetical protein F4803DRAFT_505151 [Xylaria telfairii]|nr:hypothetical protein F4803DRAFT_505151 [Xylaria telfairii]